MRSFVCRADVRALLLLLRRGNATRSNIVHELNGDRLCVFECVDFDKYSQTNGYNNATNQSAISVGGNNVVLVHMNG